MLCCSRPAGGARRRAVVALVAQQSAAAAAALAAVAAAAAAAAAAAWPAVRRSQRCAHACGAAAAAGAAEAVEAVGAPRPLLAGADLSDLRRPRRRNLSSIVRPCLISRPGFADLVEPEVITSCPVVGGAVSQSVITKKTKTKSKIMAEAPIQWKN